MKVNNIILKWLFAATPKSADSLCACVINQQILSNVRSGWLVMPLVSGFLHCLLACHTIEKKRKFSLSLPALLRLLSFVIGWKMLGVSANRILSTATVAMDILYHIILLLKLFKRNVRSYLLRFNVHFFIIFPLTRRKNIFDNLLLVYKNGKLFFLKYQ